MTEPPRLMSGTDTAAYCGITLATLATWVAAGQLPKPLPGTRRWDRKAVDAALDWASGIAPPALSEGEAALEKWRQQDAVERRGPLPLCRD